MDLNAEVNGDTTSCDANNSGSVSTVNEMAQTTGLLALFPLQILGTAPSHLPLPRLQHIISTHLKPTLSREGDQFSQLHRRGQSCRQLHIGLSQLQQPVEILERHLRSSSGAVLRQGCSTFHGISTRTREDEALEKHEQNKNRKDRDH